MDEHGIWLTSDFSEGRSTVCFMTAIFFSELFLSAHWIGNGAILLDNIYTKFGTYERGLWMIVCFMASSKITRPVVAFLCRLLLNKRTDPVIIRRRISYRFWELRAGEVRDEQSGDQSDRARASESEEPTSSQAEASSRTSSESSQYERPPRGAQLTPRNLPGVSSPPHKIDQLRYVPTKIFQVTAMVASLILGCCMVGFAFITHYTVQVVLYGVSTGILTVVISTCTRYHIKQFYRTYPYHIHKFMKQLARCISLVAMSVTFPFLPLIDETYRSSIPFFLLATFAVPLVMIQVFLRFCTHKSQASETVSHPSEEPEMDQLMSRYANYRGSPSPPATFSKNLKKLLSKFANNFRSPFFVFFFFIAVLSSALIVEVFSLYLVSFPYLLYEQKHIMVDPLKESSFRSGYIAFGWLPTVLVAYLGPHNSKKENEWIARLPSRNRLSRRLATFVFGLILITISLLKHKVGQFFRDPGYMVFGIGSAAVFYLEKDVFSLIFKSDLDVIVPFIQIATGLVILIVHPTWLAVTMQSAGKDFSVALADAGHWILLGVAVFWTMVLLWKTGKFFIEIWPTQQHSVPLTDNLGPANEGSIQADEAGNSGIAVDPAANRTSDDVKGPAVLVVDPVSGECM